MKTFSHAAIAVAALFGASACGPQAAPSAPQTAAPEAATPTAVDGAKPGAAEQSAFVTPAALVGRWGDNGDCTKDIVINADGTFHSYTGGGGNWTLIGGVMTMSGSGGVFAVRVQIINSNTLIIQNPDGSVGTSQRC